ncbi:exocyst complex component 3-like protein [Electrophorus electricus]|uniref:exocyst complex component 3-like protein n=1 Tax=Electrophorus electricus TaxID=8005 RepID=UPI000F0A0A58|nr:exocyst complex component 3-like protein [Electrophorus electricus]
MAGNGKAESDWASEVSDILMWDNGSQQTEITGNSKAQSNGKGKKLGVMKSLRESIKRAGEKSPLPMNKKGIKCKTEMADIGNEPGNMSDPQIQPPSSPSLSIGSLPSPQQKLDSVVVLGDEPPKKRQTSRWSFRLGNRKEKTCQPEQLEVVTEVTRGAEEVGMSYTLPEIPLSPLSVMQIKKLIDMEVLEEAYLNLLSLRLEFQREKEALGEEALPLELAHKDKDLSLLYSSLRTKLTDIVQKSCALPSRNKELLVHVACIVQEEEKRERDVGGMLGWRDVWRAAVQEGVRDTIRQVHLDSYEQNPSWLAVHLGLLGKAIVADLEKVKSELLSSYPPSFNVFETYVSSCHEVVGEHLKRLFEKLRELRDYYALLDFIIHRYPSENVMGRISLQPELTDEQRALKLDGVFLEQIKTGYYNCLQVEIRLSLDKVTELEYEEMWKDKKTPEIEEGIYSSHIDMDIWMNVKGKIQASKDVNLEQKAVYCCLEELKQFPRRFEADFVKYSDTVQDPSLWAAYHITYINSFSALKNHMENYKESCPYQVEQLGKEVDGLVQRLWQALLEYFKTDIKPFLRMMMTKTWLTSDEDFQQLVKRIRTLSQQCRHCSPERVQAFVSDMHYSVVRGYVSQLMKNNYTCKNRKNERAATKIREQWGELKEVFQEMNSVHHWLYPVGDHLSKIIGYRNKSEIKNILQPLIDDYPDISKRHLSAILYFRGMIRGRERQIILQQFSNQKQQSRNAESTQHALFADIPAAVNTDCLANMPFSCLYGLLPDS